jgi:hypothetical protein
VNGAAIVLLREVFGGLVLDSEIRKSLTDFAGWLAKHTTPSM